MYKSFLKRVFDVVISFVAVIVLLVPMALIALAVKLTSHGPVLFTQKRVGKGKKLFTILKFRTMRTDAPKDVPTNILAETGEWITPIGGFLRKTGLDELPQLFNILVGQMSFVGPRPVIENDAELILLRDECGANDIRPGLTGLAQINGRDRISDSLKAKFDGEYVKRLNGGFFAGIFTDLRCLFGTVPALLKSDSVPECSKESADNEESVLTDEDVKKSKERKISFIPKKRWLRVVSLVLLSLLCVWVVLSILPTPKNYDTHNPLMKNGDLPMIVAHRGGRDEFPQNTLEAFYNAYSIDENVIMETDVNLTKDGVLILLHNELLDATTNVTGLASDWNYSDLISERVDFGYDNPTEDTVLAGEREYFTVNGERRLPKDVIYPEGVSARDEEIYLVTTLEELLVAFPNNRISVEIKQSGELGLRAVSEAVRLLEKYDAFDRVILASFHSEIYKEFKRLDKNNLVPECFMYSPGIMGIVKFYSLMTLGIDSLFGDGVALLQIPMEEYGFNFATKRLINTAHKHNLAVHYWTIDNERDMRTLIELGADAIMTDNPSLLKRVLDSYK